MNDTATQAHTSTAIQAEPWVDAEAVGEHIGYKADHVRKMTAAGRIPGHSLTNGKRKHWRYKISEVDKALAKGMKQ